VIHYINF